MSAWRCFGRLLANCSQLVSQKPSRLVTKNCGAFGGRQLSSRTFSDHSNPATAIASNGRETLDTLYQGATAAQSAAGKAVSEVRRAKVRRIKGAPGKGKEVFAANWKATPVSDQIADSWRQLSFAEQDARLRTLPMKSQWAFLERLEASGLRPDIELWNSALHALHLLPRPDWSAEELETLGNRLWAKGYPPHVSLYVTLLNACRRRHKIDHAFELHDEMIAKSIPPNQDTVLVLAQILGRGHRGQNRISNSEAKAVLDEVEAFLEKMRAVWRVDLDLEIAKLLAKAVRLACEPSPFSDDLAGRCFEIVGQILGRLREQGLKLDDTVCALVLDIFAHEKGDLTRVHHLVGVMKSAGDSVGERVYSRLIQWYMQRGQFEKANGLLVKVERENVTFLSHGLGIVIDLFATQGRYAEAERRFQEAEIQGDRLDPLVVLAHMRTCYLQGKFAEIVEAVGRHVGLFNWDPRGLGKPNPIVSKLLEALQYDPKRKNRDLIQQALQLCPSEVAEICWKLLPDKVGDLSKLPLHILKEYYVWEPKRAFETMERIVDCLWLLERRGRAMKLMQWATSNGLFPGVWQPTSAASEAKVVTVDLHGLSLSPGKALVLVALSESVAYPESLRHVTVITGRGNHRATGGVMLSGVQRLLKEYNLPYEVIEGKGGVTIGKEDLRQWMSRTKTLLA